MADLYPNSLSREAFTEGGFGFLKRVLAENINRGKPVVINTISPTGTAYLQYHHHPSHRTFMEGITVLQNDVRAVKNFMETAGDFQMQRGLSELAADKKITAQAATAAVREESAVARSGLRFLNALKSRGGIIGTAATLTAGVAAAIMLRNQGTETTPNAPQASATPSGNMPFTAALPVGATKPAKPLSEEQLARYFPDVVDVQRADYWKGPAVMANAPGRPSQSIIEETENKKALREQMIALRKGMDAATITRLGLDDKGITQKLSGKLYNIAPQSPDYPASPETLARGSDQLTFKTPAAQKIDGMVIHYTGMPITDDPKNRNDPKFAAANKMQRLENNYYRTWGSVSTAELSVQRNGDKITGVRVTPGNIKPPWPAGNPYHYQVAFDRSQGRFVTAAGRDTSIAGDTNTGYNTSGKVQLVFDGNNNDPKATLPAQQMEKIEKLITWQMLRHGIPIDKVKLHDHEAPGVTTCPGAAFETAWPHMRNRIAQDVSRIRNEISHDPAVTNNASSGAQAPAAQPKHTPPKPLAEPKKKTAGLQQ
jgi:hypothetical protein